MLAHSRTYITLTNELLGGGGVDPNPVVPNPKPKKKKKKKKKRKNTAAPGIPGGSLNLVLTRPNGA
jgi:hypothetical protein